MVYIFTMFSNLCLVFYATESHALHGAFNNTELRSIELHGVITHTYLH